MKRIIFAFALVLLLPLAAFGQTVDRDILLTSEGTLFTAESIFTQNSDSKTISSTRYLALTIQDGDKSSTQVIPASMNGGAHVHPALAYDSDTKTLFVFWEAARNGGLASDLLFCSYQDAKWGTPTAIDTVDWDLRVNLRIALTRKTEDATVNGGQQKVILNEINVHAVWWQEGGASEWGRYAMLTIEKGNVRKDGIQVLNLTDFLSHSDPTNALPSSREILRHPAIFESTSHDTVDVVFGDTKTDKMHRVTLRPVVQPGVEGRIRIPIGKDRDIPTPSASTFANEGVGAISFGDNIAYYYADKDSLKYILLKDGAWTPIRTIALNEKLSSEAAVSALRKMVSSE